MTCFAHTRHNELKKTKKEKEDMIYILYTSQMHMFHPLYTSQMHMFHPLYTSQMHIFCLRKKSVDDPSRAAHEGLGDLFSSIAGP